MPKTSDSAPEEDGEAPEQGPEILFYHLQRAHLMDVLPSLLAKSLQRGWRCVVQADNEKQAERLNTDLWSWRDDSFLPHGTASDGFKEQQPVYLTHANENPNRAAIRFFIGGAQPLEVAGYERIVYLFDGGSEEALNNAREQWKRFASENHNATYWAQGEHGGWEKKA